MKGILFFSLLICAMELNAQRGVFKWNDEMCEYTGYFDSVKLQRKQIVSAQVLISSEDRPVHALVPGIFSIQEMAHADTAHISTEYRRLKEKYTALQLPASAQWAAWKEQQLEELEAYYKMGRALATAYKTENYAGIEEYNAAVGCSVVYTKALQAGGDSLLHAWKELVAQNAQNNASPERIWAEYRQKLATPDKYLYAKLDILTFGWSNCVLAYIKPFDQGGAILAFRKLFKSVKELCDE